MGLAQIQFYQNKYYYPHYSETISKYGQAMDCTPVGIGLKDGKIRVKGDMSYFMSCNYVQIARDNERFFGWIEDVRYLTDSSFEVSYRVDPWRTYKDHIDLDVQLIERQPQPTNVPDPLLGSENYIADFEYVNANFENNHQRTLVVMMNFEGVMISNSPVQPSPYTFFMCHYNINNPLGTQAVEDLINAITGTAQPKNVVSVYSIPYVDLTGLTSVSFPIDYDDSTRLYIQGFQYLSETDSTNFLSNETPIDLSQKIPDIDAFMRKNHSLKLVIPEAGIMDIQDEMMAEGTLYLRQDIDLYSGACNYMLFNTTIGYGTQSLRGSSVASIPIVSDPLQTYLSQNQNALNTALMGDVANVAMATGAGAVGGSAIPGVGTVVGAIGGFATSGVGAVQNYYGREATKKDMANKPNNPSAFLGTATANEFNGKCWVIIETEKADNPSYVHDNLGYKAGVVKPLVFPSVGYVQTRGCAVFSDGTVPNWAIGEINNIFDNGICVH